MEFASKSVSRDFAFDLSGLGAIEDPVRQILGVMEKKTIGVIRPDDEDAFETVRNEEGAILLGERATLEVDIAEWLCVVCQRVRLYGTSQRDHEVTSEHVTAWYSNNAAEVLFPVDTYFPPVGPVAMFGELVLAQLAQGFLTGGDQFNPDKFCCVVAHELTHVFDKLRVVVPAFMNWEVYWERALGHGTMCDVPREMMQLHSQVLDQYGEEGERASIEEFWPSHARQWCDAFWADAE